MNPRLSRPRLSLLCLALGGLALAQPTQAAPLDISQVPPTLGQTLAPNILYIQDDSGSMTWAYMPDANSSHSVKRYTSSTWNGIYFNPEVDYPPPLDHNGESLGDANFNNAWRNGYLSNRNSYHRNLDDNYRVTRTLSGSSESLSNSWTGNAYKRAFYHEFTPAASGCNGSITDEDCYVRKVVTAEQEQNFANWYSYYRTREMAAKAGISRAFAQLGEGARIGYGRINKSTSSNIDGKSLNTIIRGVRPFSDDPDDSNKHYRKQFFDWLLSLSSSGNTPLRRALDSAGRYYENDSDNGPWSTTPGVSGGNHLSCRKSFTILMTDGFWNDAQASTSAARQNTDGTEGNPFADDYSNTLADVAMYYWKRDLRTDLDNRVPPTHRDPATWQHMTTYTVGLGVEPTGIKSGGNTLSGNVKETVFAALSDPSLPTIEWPRAQTNSANNIADLLHAGVNGRGDFFSAGNPTEFAAAMQATLASISDQVGSIAPLGQSSNSPGGETSGDTLLFQGKFDTEDWSGWLTATAFDPDTGKLKALPTWTSSLPAAGARQIFTWNPDSASGVTFSWSSLSTAQQTLLGNGAELFIHTPTNTQRSQYGQDILNWLRGSQSKEEPSGKLRRRSSTGLLGDIVNSKPLYVSSRNQGYANRVGLSSAERSAYQSRVDSTAFKQRKRMVYVGANDGMLHAFDAGSYLSTESTPLGDRLKFSDGDGKEVFAYVPAAVYSKLPNLAHPEYSHLYYVDGSPVSGDAYLGNQWKTVLVGATGAGGRAYFALDIDNPAAMDANKVMWEFTHNELGLSIGQASIARAANGKWVAIFGNGYNSPGDADHPGHKAQLFIVDLSDGTLLQKIDTGVGSISASNGLASPLVLDVDLDGVADLVYAGDFHGNLWKFDLSASDPDKWEVAFGGKPLFKATDSTGKAQPISAAPTARRHPDKDGLVLYFGTGKLMLVGDQGDLSEQALYGVFDLCGSKSSDDCAGTGGGSRPQRVLKSELLAQAITAEDRTTFGSGAEAVTSDYRLVSQHELEDSHRGFHLTLTPPAGTFEGERVVGPASVAFNDRIIYTTMLPNEDPCEQGAEGWIMELDPFSGGRKDYSVFDMNNDGFFDGGDSVVSGEDSTPVSGRRSPGGASIAVIHSPEKSFKLGTQSVVVNRPDPNLLNRQAWQETE